MTNPRAKGIGFERQVAKLFTRWFPDARRGLQYQAGEHCPDIVKTPFYIECKRGRKYLWDDHVSYDPQRQSDREWLYGIVELDAEEWDGKYETILIVWKLDRQPIKVTLDFRYWLKMKRQRTSGDLSLITVRWDEFAEVLDAVTKRKILAQHIGDSMEE